MVVVPADDPQRHSGEFEGPECIRNARYVKDLCPLGVVYSEGAKGSAVLRQALKAAEEAEKEWEADSPEARKEALSAAQNAADFAQQTYKHLRLVHN